MKLTMLSIRSIAAACALCAVATVPAMAAQNQTAKKPGDPARWYQGNKNQQQSLGTIKKEINAAYAQQKTECGRGAKSERASCLEQARQVYRDDMANAKQLVADAPSGGVSERVVSTTTTPSPADGSAAGATAMGSSQGGTTASSGADSGAGVSDTTPRSLDEGAAATGNSGTGISASGSGETNAAGSSSTGSTDAGTGTGPQPIAPQPMQPPPLVTPPRSEDTPIQR